MGPPRCGIDRRAGARGHINVADNYRDRNDRNHCYDYIRDDRNNRHDNDGDDRNNRHDNDGDDRNDCYNDDDHKLGAIDTWVAHWVSPAQRKRIVRRYQGGHGEEGLKSALARVLVPAPDIEGEVIGEEYLLYDGRQARAYRFNGSAALILGLCDGVRSIEGICEMIGGAYPDAPASLQEDVLATLAELEGYGLVVQA